MGGPQAVAIPPFGDELFLATLPQARGTPGHTEGRWARETKYCKATTEAGGGKQNKAETELRTLWRLGSGVFSLLYICLNLSQVRHNVYQAGRGSLIEIVAWINNKHGINMQKH